MTLGLEYGPGLLEFVLFVLFSLKEKVGYAGYRTRDANYYLFSHKRKRSIWPP